MDWSGYIVARIAQAQETSMNGRRTLTSLWTTVFGCTVAFTSMNLPTESASATSARSAAERSREATFKKAQVLREEGVALLDDQQFEQAKAKFEEALALHADSDGLNKI